MEEKGNSNTRSTDVRGKKMGQNKKWEKASLVSGSTLLVFGMGRTSSSIPHQDLSPKSFIHARMVQEN